MAMPSMTFVPSWPVAWEDWVTVTPACRATLVGVGGASVTVIVTVSVDDCPALVAVSRNV